VYILILPGMGIVSEILPVFSRKPLFGYSVVVFSGIAIGFLGWGVWAHHMFVTGIGPVATSAFGVSTMLIAIPTGVKIFNWLGTVWGGSLRLNTPLLFSLGFIAMFTIGGLSGVTHSIVPADTQQTDTYYVVAHFHYVLFGGLVFAIFGGFYYWWPKIFGRMLDDKIGKVNFWLMLIGFNLTFFPMHILGLQGQPRRTYRYASGMGWDLGNQLATIGAFTIALGVAVFVANLVVSLRSRRPAGDDPWEGQTLEWATSSPPPRLNFNGLPPIRSYAPLLDLRERREREKT
jgi:cytochrome c oxidase subunit 1